MKKGMFGVCVLLALGGGGGLFFCIKRSAALHNYCGSDQSLIITHIPSHMESRRRDWNQLVNRGLIRLLSIFICLKILSSKVNQV
jgi:hypothetical protein